MNGKQLEDALVNWGQWARDRHHKQHCASLESRYRPPRGVELEWETAAPPPPPFYIDILAAVALQKQISKLGFQYAWALTFAYCYPKFNRHKAAAFCKVYTPAKLLALQKQARIMLANLTNRSERKEGYKLATSTEQSVQIAREGHESPRQGRVFLKAA